MPSNRDLNHLIVSSWVILWPVPIFDLHRRRVATRAPGRVLQCISMGNIYPREHSHDNIEVHAIDTNAGIVLDTKIDVLADTETEVARFREVAFPELILLNL